MRHDIDGRRVDRVHEGDVDTHVIAHDDGRQRLRKATIATGLHDRVRDLAGLEEIADELSVMRAQRAYAMQMSGAPKKDVTELYNQILKAK